MGCSSFVPIEETESMSIIGLIGLDVGCSSFVPIEETEREFLDSVTTTDARLQFVRSDRGN